MKMTGFVHIGPFKAKLTMQSFLIWLAIAAIFFAVKLSLWATVIAIGLGLAILIAMYNETRTNANVRYDLAYQCFYAARRVW